MKKNEDKKTNKKFTLEKMEVAKLKNMRSIIGGGNPDDPIDTGKFDKDSSGRCHR
jgi:hypothetical protein